MQAGIRLACGKATYSFVMQAGDRYVLPYLRWCRDLTYSAYYTYRVPASAGHDPPGVLPSPIIL
jgi:hypothetical protein